MRTAAHAVTRVLDATVGRVLRLLLTGLIAGYQRFVSPVLGPRCRFYPSCSSYALEAVQVHGAVKGAALATARVCRCHPWNPGGVDHVPPRGAWKPAPYVALESHDLPGFPAPDAPAAPSTTPHDRSAA